MYPDNRNTKEQENVDTNTGSKSDPQKTEWEELKQGGKEPIVHADDKEKKPEENKR